MECSKCKVELVSGSKYCNKCGEIIKEDRISELVISVQKHWFLYGYMMGRCSANEKIKNPLKKLKKK